MLSNNTNIDELFEKVNEYTWYVVRNLSDPDKWIIQDIKDALYQIIGAILGIVYILSLLYIIKNYQNLSFETIGVNILLLFLFIHTIGKPYYNKIYLQKRRRYLQNLRQFNEERRNDMLVIDNIDKILKNISSLYREFCTLVKYQKSDALFSKFWFKYQLDYFLFILSDLRSDLTIRLAEQQKTLEKAKNEIEQNIKWTSKLNQVSELQRARLDRQIEQFEELQRVLVKV
jgi:hypothetical protein